MTRSTMHPAEGQSIGTARMLAVVEESGTLGDARIVVGLNLPLNADCAVVDCVYQFYYHGHDN